MTSKARLRRLQGPPAPSALLGPSLSDKLPPPDLSATPSPGSSLGTMGIFDDMLKYFSSSFKDYSYDDVFATKAPTGLPASLDAKAQKIDRLARAYGMVGLAAGRLKPVEFERKVVGRSLDTIILDEISHKSRVLDEAFVPFRTLTESLLGFAALFHPEPVFSSTRVYPITSSRYQQPIPHGRRVYFPEREEKLTIDTKGPFDQEFLAKYDKKNEQIYMTAAGIRPIKKLPFFVFEAENLRKKSYISVDIETFPRRFPDYSAIEARILASTKAQKDSEFPLGRSTSPSGRLGPIFAYGLLWSSPERLEEAREDYYRASRFLGVPIRIKSPEPIFAGSESSGEFQDIQMFGKATKPIPPIEIDPPQGTVTGRFKARGPFSLPATFRPR